MADPAVRSPPPTRFSDFFKAGEAVAGDTAFAFGVATIATGGTTAAFTGTVALGVSNSDIDIILDRVFRPYATPDTLCSMLSVAVTMRTAGCAHWCLPSNAMANTSCLQAKISQAGLAVGRIAFSTDPVNEAVEVGIGYILGRAGGAAAGQAFRAAGASGLVNSVASRLGLSNTNLGDALAIAGISPARLANARRRGSAFISEVGNDIADRFGEGVSGFLFGNPDRRSRRQQRSEARPSWDSYSRSQTLQTSQEVMALLDQGSAFTRTASQRGIDISNGLPPGAGDATATQNFGGGDRRWRGRRSVGTGVGYGANTVEQARTFFSSCIAFCGGSTGSTVTNTDPLIIDIDGDGVGVINQATSSVFFDMDASGTVNEVSWIDAEDGFLVRDLNNNGIIDDASEMFSSSTDAATRTGFDALARHDDNLDGKIDADDDVFETLLVWRDLNSDGRTDPGELLPLISYGVVGLPLTKVATPQATPLGDLIFGGDACTMSNDRPAGSNVTILWEVGLVTLSDPEYLEGNDLVGGVRQYFGKDTSRLLVILDNDTTVDFAALQARTVYGSPFDDYLNASAASPVFIRGGKGNDTIIGGPRPDMISGEAGADRLDGGAGNDILWIDGDDTLVQGGEGFDIVIVERLQPVTIDLFTAGVEVIYAGPGNDVITMSGGDYGVRVRAGDGNDTVTLTGGDE